MWYSTPGYAVDIALDSVQLIIEIDDYITIVKDFFKRKYDCNVEVSYVKINPAGYTETAVSSHLLSDSNQELIRSNGLDLSDGYGVTLAVLRDVFKTGNVRSYADRHDSENAYYNNEASNVPFVCVQLKYEDYIRWHDYIQKYIDLPPLTDADKARLIALFFDVYSKTANSSNDEMRWLIQDILEGRLPKNPPVYGYKKELMELFPQYKEVFAMMNDPWTPSQLGVIDPTAKAVGFLR